MIGLPTKDTKGPFLRPSYVGTELARTQFLINQSSTNRIQMPPSIRTQIHTNTHAHVHAQIHALHSHTCTYTDTLTH